MTKQTSIPENFSQYGVPQLSKTVSNMANRRGLDVEICVSEDDGRIWLWVCPLDSSSDQIFAMYGARFDLDYEEQTADFRGWQLETAVNELEDLPAFICANRTELHAKELIKHAAALGL